MDMDSQSESNQLNFDLIKYISDEKEEPKVQHINLHTVFEAIIHERPLDVNRKNLDYIFNHDLTIDTENLDKRLVLVLYESVIYYVVKWPGWKRNSEYVSGTLQFDEWFEKYRQYLIYKINFLIKNSSKYAEEKPDIANAQTQTNAECSKKPNSPYSLFVGGSPALLNSIVFIDHLGTNIFIKPHNESSWQNLDVKQFLNCPHVSIEVKLPEISIKRTNVHKTERSINLRGDILMAPEVKHIMHITRMSEVPDSELTPYTYKFFFYYFLQLNQVLSNVGDINANRLNELSVIFGEFLNDIKEVAVYDSTMATCVTVGFNIGKSVYVRNKKIISGPSKNLESLRNAINFYEVLVPQVDVSLNHFNAVQDLQDTENITFESLNLLQNKRDDATNPDVDKLRYLINNTCISYNCTFCKEYFSGSDAYDNATKHFKDKHKAEQAVVCSKCKKHFEIKFLAEQRWSHNCRL